MEETSPQKERPKKRASPRSPFFSGSWLHAISSVLYSALIVAASIVYVYFVADGDMAAGAFFFLLFGLELVSGVIAFHFFSYWAIDRLLRKVGAKTLSARYRRWRPWAWSGCGRALFFHIVFIAVSGLLTGGMAWIGWRLFLFMKSFGELGGDIQLSGIALFLVCVLDMVVRSAPFFALFMAYHVCVCAALGMVLRAVGASAGHRSEP